MSLEDIIKKATGPIFNNAAQIWNHTFYWHCLSPAKKPPQGEIAKAIDRDFGSFDAFSQQLQKAAIGQFGSGWAWLVKDASGKLSITTTSNAETPIKQGIVKPLLTVDVWEHAYYVDYRNDRAKHVQALIQLLNWEFATAQMNAK
jgi:Fe-Mn family superoxide dismutase